jgi:integrase/recombinase XerD
MEKGNSKQTVAFYDRFYKKLCGYLEWAFDRTAKEMPIDFMTLPASQLGFQKYLGDVSQQTINAYLRGWRAFGNYCEELGYLDGFKCSIKEVPPPVKEVYTEKELSKLLVKPEIGNFEEF